MISQRQILPKKYQDQIVADGQCFFSYLDRAFDDVSSIILPFRGTVFFDSSLRLAS